MKLLVAVVLGLALPGQGAVALVEPAWEQVRGGVTALGRSVRNSLSSL